MSTPEPLPAAQPETAGSTTTADSGVRRLWQIGALVAALAVLTLSVLNTHVRMRESRSIEDQRHADALTLVAGLQKDASDLRATVEALKDELADVKGQRADLEQVIVDISRSRDEALLIEVERMINAASNDLLLSGNLTAAISALQAADARLARAERGPLVTLRRALARDLERLRGLPKVDITGIALRLDEIAAGVDAWPMLADPATPLAKKVSSTTTQRSAADKSDKSLAPEPAPVGFWNGVRHWLATEFGDLVRIREVQAPDSVLLPATQQQLVRQQLRLRLFDARQALIARNDKLFRADLQEARVLLLRYFDLKQSASAAALAQVDKLAVTALSVDIPNAALAETNAALAAARVARPAPGRGS